MKTFLDSPIILLGLMLLLIMSAETIYNGFKFGKSARKQINQPTPSSSPDPIAFFGIIAFLFLLCLLMLMTYYAGCTFAPYWTMKASYDLWFYFPDWWKPAFSDPNGSCFIYAWRVPIYSGVVTFIIITVSQFVAWTIGALLGLLTEFLHR